MDAEVQLLKKKLDQKTAHLNNYQQHRYQVIRLERMLDLMEEENQAPPDLKQDFKALIDTIKTDLPLLKRDIARYDTKFRATIRKARMHYARTAPGRNMLIGMVAGIMAGITITAIWDLPYWITSSAMLLGAIIGLIADVYAERRGKVL